MKLTSIESIVKGLNDAGRPQDLADIAELGLLHGDKLDA